MVVVVVVMSVFEKILVELMGDFGPLLKAVEYSFPALHHFGFSSLFSPYVSEHQSIAASRVVFLRPKFSRRS